MNEPTKRARAADMQLLLGLILAVLMVVGGVMWLRGYARWQRSESRWEAAATRLLTADGQLKESELSTDDGVPRRIAIDRHMEADVDCNIELGYDGLTLVDGRSWHLIRLKETVRDDAEKAIQRTGYVVIKNVRGLWWLCRLD